MFVIMKILVTGGTGYIGSHTIVALLQAGFDVINIDNLSNSEESVLDGIREITGKEHTFINADLRDYNWLHSALQAQGKIDAVIHFAALKSVGESVQKPLLYFDNNINGMVNVLKLMSSLSIPDLVFSSSCTVYGQPEILPVTESAPFLPAQSPYGYTKQVCETLIHDCVRAANKLSAVSLRYFNPIGAHSSSKIGELPKGIPNNLVPFITQSAMGIRPEIQIFGNDYSTSDGTCVRDYIHVMDLADAHVAAIRFLQLKQAPSLEVINIGTGKGVSVLEAVHAFENSTGVKLNYRFAPRRPGDVEQVWANSEKAEKLLGWKAIRTLEDSMRDAWNWEKKLRNESN